FAFRGNALLAKLNRTKHLAHARSVDNFFVIFPKAFGNKAARQLATTGTYLAFKIADAGFAGKVPDDFQQALVGKLQLFQLETVAFSLFRDQMSFSNFQLLAFRVT